MRWYSALFASVFLAAPSCLAAQNAPVEPSVIFVVRHADRVPGLDSLTDAGRVRAQDLARFLADADLDSVFTTDVARTRATAAPAAARIGVSVATYAPNEHAQLATRLTRPGLRSLVVGHSNTVPELVRALGADPGPPIREADEFDRLYVVTVVPGGATTSAVLLRYGGPGAP